jgi:hypothetical protein
MTGQWNEPGAGIPDPPPGITPGQWIRAVALTAAAGVTIQSTGGSYSGRGEDRVQVYREVREAAERFARFIERGE